MTQYGVRFFELTIRSKSRGRRKLPLVIEKEVNAATYFLRQLSEMRGKLLVGRPPFDPPVDAVELRSAALDATGGPVDVDDQPAQLRGKPVIRIESVRRHEQEVSGSLLMGRYGEHELALGYGDEPDTPLDGKAPARRYRFQALIPDSGQSALLAVEAIGNSCPVHELVQWVGRTARNEAMESAGDDGTQADWWRFVVEPAIDERQLNRMLRSGRAQSIVLKRKAPTVGRTPNRDLYTVTAPHLDQTLAAHAKDTVRDLIRRLAVPTAEAASTDAGDEGDRADAPESPTDATAAQEMAALIGPELAGVPFDDGWVVFKDENGGVRRVSPSRVADTFTYTLGDRQPTDLAFSTAVRNHGGRIARAAQWSIRWPQD